MATSGGFIIGVKNVPPIPPRLVIVIEPPWNSFLSIFKFLHLSLTSFNFWDKSETSFSGVSLTDLVVSATRNTFTKVVLLRSFSPRA